MRNSICLMANILGGVLVEYAGQRQGTVKARHYDEILFHQRGMWFKRMDTQFVRWTRDVNVIGASTGPGGA